MRQIWQWLGCLLLLAGLAAGLALAPGGPDAAAPRLVVLLAVDQLRTEYLDRFEDQYSGGLKWLLDHGAYFPDAAYRHSTTVTGAGHATIATGLHPSTHGIVGNSWREADKGDVYCVEDARYAAVGGPGDGTSPLALLADTLGDRLKARYSEAKVYSFSTKDRSAVLMGGRQADGAFWYRPGCGCLVSSTYYADALPDWLQEFNAGQPSAAYAGRDWVKLLGDDALYERLARRDDFPTEGDGTDKVFPHSRPAEEYESTLAATPFSDEITLGAALAALRSGEIGNDSSPDLLAIGLSATDSVGHRYGPFSQEAMDNHLRLDRRLGEFFAALDKVVGLERTLIALTADHGAMPLVEHLAAAGVDAERFDTVALWERAEGAIQACGSGPPNKTVSKASGRDLYWNEDELRSRGVSRADASSCVADWLGQQRGVAAVLTAEQLAQRGGSGIAALFENAFLESRSPHIQVHLRRHLYPGRATGTGHGSAHDYDRQVPVLLAGSGVVPGRHVTAAGPEDVAPTIGAMLALEIELEHDTRVLREAMASGSR